MKKKKAAKRLKSANPIAEANSFEEYSPREFENKMIGDEEQENINFDKKQNVNGIKQKHSKKYLSRAL